MERKRRQKRYRRLDRAERAAIQNGLERGWSCRRMARELGRSPSTVADEVARNRTVAKGPGKGERVRGVPDDACPKLLSAARPRGGGSAPSTRPDRRGPPTTGPRSSSA